MNTWSYLILIAALLLLAAVMLYARFATRSREKSLHHAPGEPSFPNETISATRYGELETSRVNSTLSTQESRPEIRIDRVTASLSAAAETTDGSKKSQSDYFDELQDAAAGLAMLMRSSPVRRSEPMIFAPEEVEDEVELAAESEVEAEADLAVKIEAEVEAGVAVEVEAEVKTEVEGDVAAEIEADVAAEVEAGVEPEVEDVIEAEVEAEAETDVEGDVAAEVDADVAAEVDADVAAEIETVVAAEVERDVEPEVEAEAEADVESEVEAETEADVESEVEAEADAEPEVEADVAAEVEDDVAAERKVETDVAAEPIAEQEPEVELIMAELVLARECSAGSEWSPFNRAPLITAQPGRIVAKGGEETPAAILGAPEPAQLVSESLNSVAEARAELNVEFEAEPIAETSVDALTEAEAEPITEIVAETLAEPAAETALEEFEISLPVEVRVLTVREILGDQVSEKINQIDAGLDALEQLVRSIEASLQSLDSVDLFDEDEDEMVAASAVTVSAAA